MNWWEILWEKRWMAIDIANKLLVLNGIEVNIQDFQDLISEMLIGAFRRLRRFNYNPEIANLNTVVWKALFWACKDWIRKRHRNQTIHFNLEILQINEEKRRIVREAIEEIHDERWKTALKLRLEGYSIMEISEIMNCSEATVKRYLREAIKFLIDYLQEFPL